MPLTRSQKKQGVPRGASSSASQHTEQLSERTRSEGSASVMNSEATASNISSRTSITESPETTATESTVNTKRSIETGDRLKQLKMAEQKNQNSSLATLIPGGSTRASVKSVRTSRSAARLRDLEIREKLARLELQRIEAEANLARISLEKQNIEAESSVSEDNLEIEQEDRKSHVQNWIQTSPLDDMKDNIIPEEEFEENQVIVKAEQPLMSTVQVQTLAGAIRQAFDSHTTTGVQLPSNHQAYQDLPYFDGTSSEWVAFRVVYDDTSKSYTATQNMARLRKAIKGAARNTFKSLLYSDASPDQIMKALQRRYGRPDSLVMEELDRIKALPKISATPKDICAFASDIHNCISAIQGLQKPQYLCSPVMVREIVEKLPTYLKFRWYDYANTHEDKEPADLVLMAQFLNKQADTCGAYAPSDKKKQTRGREATHTATEEEEDEPQSTKKEVKQEKKWNCANCQGNHYLSECQRFVKMSVDERWALVVKQRICFKCLMGRHRKTACRKPPCKICKQWHHSLLHSEKRSQEQMSGATNSAHEFEKENAEQAMTASMTLPVHAVRTTRAYLKMIPVEVFGPKGSQKILALLDEGSTVSLLDSQIAKNIGAKGTEEELVLETVGGKLIRKKDSERLSIIIRGVHQEEKKNLDRVRTIDELNLAPQFLDKGRIEKCSHLKEMASILYYEFEPPRLLIGQDNWELIVSQEIKRGKPGQPVASLTELGWVLHGFDNTSGKPVHFLNKCLHMNTIENEMHNTIKEHFAIESLGVQPRRPTTDSEGRALAILEKTCRRREDGRFEVGLLWKNEDDHMPESYKAAERRLFSIEKKMDKDVHLRDEYIKQIQHLLEENYAEEAPDNQNSERKWYLPHFSVIHPLKKKVKIVFDVAAKSQGRSLNDALLPGPDLLQSLFGVLASFRQGPTAVAADIKEMFLQIKIRTEDRDSLRYLWREGRRDTPMKEYRMNIVIFGATSSPSTAIFVKKRQRQRRRSAEPTPVQSC